MTAGGPAVILLWAREHLDTKSKRSDAAMKHAAATLIPTLINASRRMHRKEKAMLWNTLSQSFSSPQNDGNTQFGGADFTSDFPQGQLTSAAWEGWWHNSVQA